MTVQACVLGSSTKIGNPVTLQQASHHIFGYMLMNDCSARDIQQWEYVPLGPFNSKNFVRHLHERRLCSCMIMCNARSIRNSMLT